MKVAHSIVVTPNACGLYETTRELASALRDQNIDSRLVDPQPAYDIQLKEDRGVPIEQMEWAKSADIVVSHSGLGKMEKWNLPVIHAAHGRPRSSFLIEESGGPPVYSYWFNSNNKSNFKAIISFWPEHEPYLNVMFPDKPVYTIQSTVDLDFWKPGKSNYDFAGKAGGVNIVCIQGQAQNDIDCYEPLNAYALWARKNKHLDPKLHIFGRNKNMKGWGALIRRIQDDGNMGLVQGWASELKQVYNAADCVLTAHKINVRVVREAMACGCPVVRITDITSDEISEGLKRDRSRIRQQARKQFNPKKSAQQFIELLNNVTAQVEIGVVS